MADQGGGGHLTAGHAIDRVVDKDGGDLLAAVGGVNDLRGTDRRQVTVALIGEYQSVLADGALDTGGNSGCAAVGSLVHIAVEIVVGKHGAADRGHTDHLAV